MGSARRGSNPLAADGLQGFEEQAARVKASKKAEAKSMAYGIGYKKKLAGAVAPKYFAEAVWRLGLARL